MILSGGDVPSSDLLHGHNQTVLSNLSLLDLRLCAVWNSCMLAHCMMRYGTNVTCLDAIMPETGVAALAVTVRFRGKANDSVHYAFRASTRIQNASIIQLDTVQV